MKKKILFVLPFLFGLAGCDLPEDKGELISRTEFINEIESIKHNSSKVPEYFKYTYSETMEFKDSGTKSSAKNDIVKVRAINGHKQYIKNKNNNTGFVTGEEEIVAFNEDYTKIKEYYLEIDKTGFINPTVSEYSLTKEEFDNGSFNILTPHDNLKDYTWKYIDEISDSFGYIDHFEKNNYYMKKTDDYTSLSIEKVWRANFNSNNKNATETIERTIKFKDNYMVEYKSVLDLKKDDGSKSHSELKIKCSEYNGLVGPRDNVKYE